MADLLVNARFLMRPVTGVDRVATELISALNQIGLPERFGTWGALRPAGNIEQPQTRPSMLLERTVQSRSRLQGHLWEQLSLARAQPDDWLVSLCNMGPVLRHRQIAMLHDAQVFRQPDSYSRAFRTFYHALQPQLGRRASMILTVSDHSRRELEHFGVVPAGKARVVPNGADHILKVASDVQVLQRHDLAPCGYFLAIGSLAPHKNIRMLTRAARMRHDRRIPLVIAGGGNRDVFSDAGIAQSEDVRLLGRVSDQELRALYENAMALVFPSITEGFGLPPVEAMFCGCPVIASTGGAVPEVCEGAALSVDPMDLEGWSAAMTRLNEDPDLRTSLKRAGMQRSKAFTWRRAAETLVQYFADLPTD